uniref:TBC1 domain family member 30 n=1 Tax=Myxine glutinosa TaxID=7769 RepID=UPI00358F2058
MMTMAQELCDCEVHEEHPSPRPSAVLVQELLTELYDSCPRAAGDQVPAQGSIGDHGRGSEPAGGSGDSSGEGSCSESFGRGASSPESTIHVELLHCSSEGQRRNYLVSMELPKLKQAVVELQELVRWRSARLVQRLRQRDRMGRDIQHHCDVLTAFLQAISPKRRIDTKLKFTVEPSPGRNGFQQWHNALKAVARLPAGIPTAWRKRVWLALADRYLQTNAIDWDKTLRFAFNEHSNPDDDSMGAQIVKDLHRTGCSAYCGQDAEPDRVVLKRVLLAYARWNKAIGYCQGFNVLAALILEVTEGHEGNALKVMIYLIDRVLPEGYFAHSLRALSVDMAVFRELLRLRLPYLSEHIDTLQHAANRHATGNYEPPLLNVFTMQWFLTLFATCLPKATVLRIWDSILFEGSEIILRVGLAIWAKLWEHVQRCSTADEFYTTMGHLAQEMLEHRLIECKELVQTVYALAPFPFPQLAELQEKYTYNITPLQASTRMPTHSSSLQTKFDSDEEIELEDDEVLQPSVGCLNPLGNFWATVGQQKGTQQDKVDLWEGSIAELSPGALGSSRGDLVHMAGAMMLERMSTDITALRQQYCRLQLRQEKDHQLCLSAVHMPPPTPQPVDIQMVNHLLLGKQLCHSSKQHNCMTLDGCNITPVTPGLNGSLSGRIAPWRTHLSSLSTGMVSEKAKFSINRSRMCNTSWERQSPARNGSMTAADKTRVEVSSMPSSPNANSGGTSLERREGASSGTDGEHSSDETKSRSCDSMDAPIADHRSSTGNSCTAVGSSSDVRASTDTRSIMSEALATKPTGDRQAFGFNPFPLPKMPRKSAAARSLGLYKNSAEAPGLSLNRTLH